MVLGEPQADEVLVKIHSASICGTDLHIYKWNAWTARTYQPPFRLGHEFGGTVVAVGPQARWIKPGQHVTAETHIPCGQCHQCRVNRRHTCDNLRLFSRSNFGCFSDYTLVPETALRAIPPEIPLGLLTIMEPLGIAVRAVAETGIAAADVLVLGCGPIGLLAIVAARAYGAASITAIDMSEYRLHLAREIGADAALPPPGNIDCCVDVLVETTGSETAFASALPFVRKGGRVVFVGLPEHPFSVDISQYVVLREISVCGVYGRRIDETWVHAERLLRMHRAAISKILTHHLHLMDFEAAFALAASRNAGKVVLVPD
jgi:threonine 3-dehydrogenase